ncbi:precorrin-8X methylmutase [Geoglobus ahangari]|uniref:Precorrin-8X methylmutase n=2 Tax=Geoglobus ahangari TaxID=113653 RepID=A0A0F7IEF5_9EURY|nr:precorrin-8X methylmutase [Geoglobus ahangari]
MQDMGNYTLDADEIVRKSYGIVGRYVEGRTPEERIVQRCIIATGDPEVRNLIAFRNNVVEEGIRAVRDGVDVVVDVKMVAAGLNRRRFRGEVLVAVEHASSSRMTRAASGMYELADRIDGGMAIIGNAPSAALALADLIKRGVRPRVVIATPVGFVNAAESKEVIRSLDVPSITSVGTRGGSTWAVAIFNGLVHLAYEDQRSD